MGAGPASRRTSRSKTRSLVGGRDPRAVVGDVDHPGRGRGTVMPTVASEARGVDRVVHQVAQHLRRPGRGRSGPRRPLDGRGRRGARAAVSATRSARPVTSTGLRCSSMPWSIRAIVSMSSTSRPARRASRITVTLSCSRWSRSGSQRRSRSAAACTPVSGVRSSWAASERNVRRRTSASRAWRLGPLDLVEHRVEGRRGPSQLGVGLVGSEPAATVACGDRTRRRRHLVQRPERRPMIGPRAAAARTSSTNPATAGSSGPGSGSARTSAGVATRMITLPSARRG